MAERQCPGTPSRAGFPSHYRTRENARNEEAGFGIQWKHVESGVTGRNGLTVIGHQTFDHELLPRPQDLPGISFGIHRRQ